MKSWTKPFNERPRPKALNFVMPNDSADFRSFDLHMFTQDIQNGILVRRVDSEGISIRFEGAEEECSCANGICALIGEDRYSPEDTVQAAVEEVVLHLAFRGRALFELIRDSAGEIAAIESFSTDGTWFLFALYLQVPPRKSWHDLENRYAVLRSTNVWSVEMPKELGGYRGYKRLLAKISAWPSIGPQFQQEDVEQGKWPKDFTIGDYRRAYEAQRYRVTRKWGWNGRDWNSQYATEYYQFYRLLTFRWSIEVLRRHVVKELNRLLGRLGIAASIILEGLPSPEEILLARDRMEAGDIDFAEASKITNPGRGGI